MPRPEQQNIQYTIDDSEIISSKITVDEIMRNFQETKSPEITDDESENNENSDEPKENTVNDDFHFSKIKDYEFNYTSKQLASIYEYYRLGNSNRLKKLDLAQIIVAFEEEQENIEIVERRKTLWFYINELKSDPYTKKYVWSP